MIIKFNGDYTKKQAIINALEEYNIRLEKIILQKLQQITNIILMNTTQATNN